MLPVVWPLHWSLQLARVESSPWVAGMPETPGQWGCWEMWLWHMAAMGLWWSREHSETWRGVWEVDVWLSLLADNNLIVLMNNYQF